MFANVPVHFSVFINIGLAFIPFALAYFLFKRYENKKQRRTWLWWLGCLLFLLFLPNSAYVLTDIIHYIAAARSTTVTKVEFWLVLTPLYFFYFTVNFEFYVVAINWGRRYLNQCLSHQVVFSLVIGINALVALGVYLGRFQRLESYDVVQKPWLIMQDVVADMTNLHKLAIIAGLFVFYFSFYCMFSYLNAFISKGCSHRPSNIG